MRATALPSAASLAVALLLGGGVLCPSATAQHNSQRGAAVGGLAGAIAGGLIGENNDEPVAGAVIGGALGAVTGAVIGDAEDRDRAYARRQADARARAHARARARAVTSADVIQMSRAGLGDAVISNEVRRRGVQQRPSVSEIIMLHQNGVSEAVITALQTAAPAAAPQPAAVEVAPAPVIIERYHAPRYYVVPRHRYHYHPRHAHRGRVGFSFGF